MSKINAEWHKANRMPAKPSTEQRLKWHTEHMKHCACRKPTDKLLAELKEHKLLP